MINLKPINLLKTYTLIGREFLSKFSKSQVTPLSINHHQKYITINSVKKSFEISSLIFNRQPLYTFSTSSNPNKVQLMKIQKVEESFSYLHETCQNLQTKIIQVSEITIQRIKKRISQEVEKQLEKYRRFNKINTQSSPEAIKLMNQQKIRIQHKFLQKQEYMRIIQTQQQSRAMIMIRLEILWNDFYDSMTIDELIFVIKRLQNCKQLKNNDLKSISIIFLSVEVVKKCILSPRINKNMICSTKSLAQNFQYIKECLKGQMEARENLTKVQNLLNFLSVCLQKKSNRYCFMKMQAQIQFLITEIFKSFNQPELYSDKSVCLTSNPPRVIFDEPFHQQFDRFLQMAVLLLFDKRFKKQQKTDKLEHVKHVFTKIKQYEEGKLQQSYQKPETTPTIMRSLKKKVKRMDKRVGIINWIQTYVEQNEQK